jgi:hypothetical protein
MPRGDTLWQRLQAAHRNELHKLGEIMGLADVNDKETAVLVEELSTTIRSAAGHSLLNMFRGPHDFPYKQILIDVADKLAPGWTPLSWTEYKLNDHHDDIEIEETIWRVYEDRVRKLMANIPEQDKADLRKEMEEDLRKAGYGDAMIAGLGAGLMGAMAVPPALAYSALANTLSGFNYLSKLLRHVRHPAVALGVLVFLLGASPILLYYLGNTNYRKTVPAALQLIYIRKLRELEDKLEGRLG